MIYRVHAPSGARIRTKPSTQSSVLAKVPQFTRILSSLQVDGEKIASFDDPATPQVESASALWIAVSGYVLPDTRDRIAVSGYVHKRLLTEVLA